MNIKLKDLLREVDKETLKVANAAEDYADGGGKIKFDIDREDLSDEEKDKLEKVEKDLEKSIDDVKDQISEQSITEGTFGGFLGGFLAGITKSMWDGGIMKELDKFVNDKKTMETLKKYKISAKDAKKMLEKMKK